MNKFFKLSENNTNIKKEVYAGIITFLTMSYIIFINPIILAPSGINPVDVFIATCLVSALGAFLMAFYANLPLAVAPGMGLNALFTYTIVMQMGYTWQNALAITSIVGVIIVLVALFLSKDAIIKAIPISLKFAVTAGIGMFIILIALENSKIIIAHPATLVTLGNIKDPKVILIALSLFLIVALSIKKLYFMHIVAIVALSTYSVIIGETHFETLVTKDIAIKQTFLSFDFNNIINISIISLMFVVFFSCFFDSFGTFISYTYFLNPKNPTIDGSRFKKAMSVEGISCFFAGVLGTSPTSIFLESNTGVSYGGRTGLTALTIGTLFLLSILFSPLIKTVPLWAASPVLIFLGTLMMSSLKSIKWEDLTESLPAVLCVVLMPLTYSISTGIACAFIAYCALKLLSGKYKEVNIFVWILTLVFILSFMAH
jgi:AGZA family xanthine/uracil permease-like MFS transporter